MMENLQNWLAMPLFSVGSYSLETICAIALGLVALFKRNKWL